MLLDKKIEKLNELSKKMERADITLDESIACFEEASVLAKDCLQELQQVVGKIKVIKQDIEKYIEEDIEL